MEEVAVLAILKQRGEAKLADIERALNMPHSSAWRLAYRLKEWGYVAVEKVRTAGGKVSLVLRPRRIVIEIEIPDELLEQLQLGEGSGSTKPLTTSEAGSRGG